MYPFLQDILITEDSSAVTIVIYNHINSVSIYSRSLIIVRLTSFYRIINLHFSIHFLFLTTLSWLWELCSNPRWPLNNQFMLTTEIASSVNTSLLHGIFSGVIPSYILSLFPRKWFEKLSTLVPASWTNNPRPSSSPLSRQYSNSIKISHTWRLCGKSHFWNLYHIGVTRPVASLLVTIVNFWQYACLSNQMKELWAIMG